jgi:hypothetical protein
MKREDDEQLWDLLGRTPGPRPSPFFARNVLRRIRQEPRWTAGWRSWLSPRRLVPVSAVALALAAAVLFTHHPSTRQRTASSDLDPIIAKIDVQDYEVVADLDDLLASDDNNLWDDTSSL